MKNWKKTLLLAPLALAIPLVSGCGGTKTDEKTINVKLLLGGYGTTWLTSLIDQFQKTYSKEGYKVNLYTPTRGNDGSFVLNDLMSGYKKRGVDLYFTGSLKPIEVYNKGDILVESLNDLVYDQKALNFDGTEESKTVREKLDPSFGKDWYQYSGQDYCYFYQRSIGALVVNKPKLAKFGFNELPITTNQYMDMIHTIREKATGQLSRIRPFVRVAGTGYASVMINSWYTQLAGISKWDQFWSMRTPEGQDMKTNGYEVFNDEELIDAGGLVFENYDFENFVTGTEKFGISDAHDYLIAEDSGGVFLYDGDWALNETATDHDANELKRLAFINVPVNSQLGTKLWGRKIQKGPDEPDDEKIDKVLAKVISVSDEGKDYSEAISAVKNDPELGVDITLDEAKAVYTARGIYNNRGVQTGNAYVAKGIDATHKDIVSKFLRMMASDDFSKMYFKTSKCFSPYSNVLDEETSLLDFSIGHKNIATHKDAYAVWPYTSFLRKDLGGELERMFPTEPKYFHTIAEDSSFSAWDSENKQWVKSQFTNYRVKAKEEIDKNYTYAKDNWSKWTA